jgi:hypothetical protein
VQEVQGKRNGKRQRESGDRVASMNIVHKCIRKLPVTMVFLQVSLTLRGLLLKALAR